MRERAFRYGDGRAIFALLAFYAFFMQTMLAYATPCPTPDLVGVICTSHGPAQSHDKPLQCDHECCAAVHVKEIMPLPSISFETVGIDRTVTSVVFSVAHLAPKTGPPTASHGARSPPVA